MSKIIIPNKKTIKVRCGYCPRIIFKEDETDGTFKKKDGKIMCPVCRATKLSNFKGEIKKDEKNYNADKLVQEKISKERALGEVTDIAVASQINLGKKYKRKQK
jgi:uncharacterized Zn finger protein (UPF0148 family)